MTTALWVPLPERSEDFSKDGGRSRVLPPDGDMLGSTAARRPQPALCTGQRRPDPCHRLLAPLGASQDTGANLPPGRAERVIRKWPHLSGLRAGPSPPGAVAVAAASALGVAQAFPAGTGPSFCRARAGVLARDRLCPELRRCHDGGRAARCAHPAYRGQPAWTTDAPAPAGTGPRVSCRAAG